MHFWTLAFPDPVLGLRVFSALCGIAALAVFIALCRRLIPKQAALASSLAAVSSFWIHFSQDGRIYGFVLLLALSATYVFLLLEERWSAARAAAYCALCTAGLYTHNFFVFVIAGHLAQVFSRRKRLSTWLAAYALILGLYLPWLSTVLSQIKLLARASVLQEPLTWHNLCYVVGTMAFDTSFLSFAHLTWTFALGLGLLVVLVAGAWAQRPDGAELFCWLQCAVPFALVRLVEAAFSRPMTQARYLIAVSPFLYILLALTLERPLNALGKILRVACVSIFLVGAIGYHVGGYYADPHLANLKKTLEQNTDKHDVIVYLDPFYYLPMRYYYLPERTHRMAGPDSNIANWEHLPGYRSYITRDELALIKRVVVIDPRHLMLKKTVGIASGADVAKVAYP